MRLPAIHARRRLNVLGINSGTSIDSVDLALVSVARRGDGCTCRYITGGERKYPPALRQRLLSAAESSALPFLELMSLDRELGRFMGQTARAFANRLANRRIAVDCVASHGQTIQHLPRQVTLSGKQESATLQIGSLETIAAATGKVTVGDFRQADIAFGGEGAPITAGAMYRLFADTRTSRLIVNIGGIANYFYLPDRRATSLVQAADCGPGNIICDALARRLFDLPYDRGGAAALHGTVSRRMLSLLMAHPAFTATRSVSTGRESFGTDLVERILTLGRELSLSPSDLMATAAQLTVEGIVMSVTRLTDTHTPAGKLYLTGGGSRNRFFVRGLRDRLDGMSVERIDTLGIPSGQVEAAAYAVMGEACLRGESLAAPVTGRRRDAHPVLGKIAQPPL